MILLKKISNDSIENVINETINKELQKNVLKLEDDKFNINNLFFKLKIISEIKENYKLKYNITNNFDNNFK